MVNPNKAELIDLTESQENGKFLCHSTTQSENVCKVKKDKFKY